VLPEFLRGLQGGVGLHGVSLEWVQRKLSDGIGLM